MSSGFEESTTKELKFAEHSEILKPLLCFLYTNEYDYNGEEANLQELGLISAFGFHIRVVALADRLLLPKLFALANEAAGLFISDDWEGSNEIDMKLEILHLLFDEGSDLKLPTKTLQDHQRHALAMIKERELFKWMLESRPNDSLLNDVSFLKKVAVYWETDSLKIEC